MWLKRCHVTVKKTPGGSQPAAAMKPHTWGDLRMSRTVPTASAQAPSMSSCHLQLSSRHNRARDPNPSRDDLTVTHPSPFKFIPQQAVTEASAVAHSMLHPRTPEIPGGMSRACQAGPSHHDHHDHAVHGRNVSMAQPSHRSSPSECRWQSIKGKVQQMSLHRSQPAKPAEQHGKNSKSRATPDPITAQVSQQATDQARRVLQLFEQVCTAVSRVLAVVPSRLAQQPCVKTNDWWIQ